MVGCGRGSAEVSVARSTAHDNKLGRSDAEMHDFCTPSLPPPQLSPIGFRIPEPQILRPRRVPCDRTGPMK
jgi:hypothetical protein